MQVQLPKLTHPTFELTIPSSGKKYNFRPMQTRERKVLLMALEAGDMEAISQANRSIFEACIENVDISTFTPFDAEWAFLQLVIHSIKDTLDLQVRIPNRENVCEECGKHRALRVDLRKAFIKGLSNKKEDYILKIDDSTGIKLRYPTEKELQTLDASKYKTKIERDMALISLSIESVWQGDANTAFADFTIEQRIEFLDSLPPPITDQLELFIRSMPTLELEVSSKCPACEYEVKHKMTGLADFFV